MGGKIKRYLKNIIKIVSFHFNSTFHPWYVVTFHVMESYLKDWYGFFAIVFKHMHVYFTVRNIISL